MGCIIGICVHIGDIQHSLMQYGNVVVERMIGKAPESERQNGVIHTYLLFLLIDDIYVCVHSVSYRG